MHRLIASSRPPKVSPRCTSGVLTVSPASMTRSGGRGVRARAEEEHGVRIARVRGEVELEGVPAGPRDLHGEALAGGVVPDHEPGVAVAVATVAAVHGKAGRREVVPGEVPLVPPARAVEVAHRVERCRPAAAGMVRPSAHALERAAPHAAGGQGGRGRAGVGDLEPAGDHRRPVELGAHGHPQRANRVLQPHHGARPSACGYFLSAMLSRQPLLLFWLVQFGLYYNGNCNPFNV